MLHLLSVRKNFIDRELLRCLPDELVLLGEILRSEDFVRLALFEKKAAAGDFGARDCGGGHLRTFLNHQRSQGITEEPSHCSIPATLIISFFLVLAINHSLDAITKVGNMKVYQKADILTTQSDV